MILSHSEATRNHHRRNSVQSLVFLHPFALFAEEYALLTFYSLVMRFPVQSGAVRSPVHLISYRALSTSSRLGFASQRDETGTKWSFRQPRQPRGDSTTLKSRLEGPRLNRDREKSDSQSRANIVSHEWPTPENFSDLQRLGEPGS